MNACNQKCHDVLKVHIAKTETGSYTLPKTYNSDCKDEGVIVMQPLHNHHVCHSTHFIKFLHFYIFTFS